ncbi:hydantoinase B/oxoprolinase family protein [Echinimonas agarilytica]|uniref:Hydantoinase B/oxoprolinase family protein n=1 Tax=Echinimonas agarilytica TaxID=1215918 RepID=A0AA41W404_9GAMM|nr:hydantoinase B/oxoprolinase family protein [Echinimonas agarilytica]MCM2678299.1 hydantoinase B/oxoprolinase family protein [Echinimonas agarilytica]
MAHWQFWIDRGGTFTDLVGKSPCGRLHVHKLLSEHAEQYQDAVTEGVRRILSKNNAVDASIDVVKMGTTVATNALLERKGDPTLLVITQGFADSLVIGYQNRPHLFERAVSRPEQLYSQVIEATERLNHNGQILTALDTKTLHRDLSKAYASGLRSCAIVFMHSYQHPQHELIAGQIARDIGFMQVSLSHQSSALIKLVSRGDTCVADAYLSPVLRRYVSKVRQGLHGANLQMMQSHGGLTDARQFHGKDAILSGPAGGVVSMVETARQAGFEQIIGFDMGGTSTDVSLFNGQYERSFETEVAGVRLRAPMLNIHTVAAGGGSVLSFDGHRMRVGPESAGASPGPRCYRNQGPLAVTDINVMLGKIQPDFFPSVFGPLGDQPIDQVAVQQAFSELQDSISTPESPKTAEQIASGFLRIAVNHMANAIKTISVQKGQPANDFVLSCFGGAGPQHACLVADELGIESIMIHPLSGVLSAFGMGLASLRDVQSQTLEVILDEAGLVQAQHLAHTLGQQSHRTITEQLRTKVPLHQQTQLALRYEGSDTTLTVELASGKAMRQAFESQHQTLFGFIQPSVALIVANVQVEVEAQEHTLSAPQAVRRPDSTPEPLCSRSVYMGDQWHSTPFYERQTLLNGQQVAGPAIIVDDTTTVVIEPDWRALIDTHGNLQLSRTAPRQQQRNIGTHADPVMLEVFNNLFMHIATHMGHVLQQTASSVNIKERLDFSCAVFDTRGELVANAPHMPVHLGSMGETVSAVLKRLTPQAGASYLVNSPYHGGTHLPDLTVVTPVFDEANELLFLVASRGHHADIGGISPGSMPAHSQHLNQEGICFECFELVSNGEFNEQQLRQQLSAGPFSARNPDQNVADLKAQLAANQKGVTELHKVLNYFGLDTVRAYMAHVQDYAELCVRRAIGQLTDGQYSYPLDNGARIEVAIQVDHRTASAIIDFTGTSSQTEDNFNAPRAVTMAAVLYVFRCLVDDDIPLNAGCMKPIDVIIPEGSMLSPVSPAAVVAGNVETSQCVCNALFAAMGTMAPGQGTMNNLIFGNDQHQYYETICGGTGAGLHGNGTDAIHCHMTNSRLTDPEVLEQRFPVVLESFSIRPNSGGQGLFTGGNGVIRRLRFTEDVEVSVLSNHRSQGPAGLNGGSCASAGQNTVWRLDGSREPIAYSAHISLQAGESIELATPGGGGFGS